MEECVLRCVACWRLHEKPQLCLRSKACVAEKRHGLDIQYLCLEALRSRGVGLAAFALRFIHIMGSINTKASIQ